MKKTHLLGLCAFLGLALSLVLFTNATKVVEKNDTYYRKVLYTNTLHFVLKYAPFKHVNQADGEYLDLLTSVAFKPSLRPSKEDQINLNQAQQLGSSCEAMRFLTKAHDKPQLYIESTKKFEDVNKDIKNKILSLLDTVKANQNYNIKFDPEVTNSGLLFNSHYKDPNRILYGGIRSYPTSPSFYSIDAALCGIALVEFYKTFKSVADQEKRELALKMSKRAAIFILNAHNPNRLYLPESATKKIKEEREPFIFYDNVVWNAKGKPEFIGGVIESVIESQSPGGSPAVNNQMHTKMGLAAEFLSELNLISPLTAYKKAALEIANFVSRGLKNNAEYYAPNSLWTFEKEKNLNEWKRAGNDNQFIFGDTVAYSLRSLDKVQLLPNEDLKNIYKKYTTASNQEYNPSKCYAGYLRVDSNSEQSIIHDSDSSYYDLVTCGIMLKFKQKYFKEDFKISQSFLTELGKKIDSQKTNRPYLLGWAQKFNGENVLGSEYKLWQDTTTMANIGESILETEEIPNIAKKQIKICGVYFADADKAVPRFIQGSWHNDLNITRDQKSCENWIRNNILTKINCAQPSTGQNTVIHGVLVDKDKYTFDLPSNLQSQEIIMRNQACLKCSDKSGQIPCSSPPRSKDQRPIRLFR